MLLTIVGWYSFLITLIGTIAAIIGSPKHSHKAMAVAINLPIILFILISVL